MFSTVLAARPEYFEVEEEVEAAPAVSWDCGERVDGDVGGVGAVAPVAPLDGGVVGDGGAMGQPCACPICGSLFGVNFSVLTFVLLGMCALAHATCAVARIHCTQCTACTLHNTEHSD